MTTSSKPIRIDGELIIEAKKLSKEKQSSIPKQINWLVRKGLKCAKDELKPGVQSAGG
jgi:hypothetical protein